MQPNALLFTYRACAAVAPTDEVRASFQRLLDDMRSQQVTEDEMCKNLFQAATDGLVNGNWPTN